jgi:hypothetical protein
VAISGNQCHPFTSFGKSGFPGQSADSLAKNAQLGFADLLRQSVYSRLADYDGLIFAERHSRDPTFRLIGSEMIWDRGAALTSRLQGFETEILAENASLAGMASLAVH